MIDYDKIINIQGNYLTQGLFYEFRHQTKLEYIPYTLKEKDFDSYISMYRVYMECDTEYEAALKLLNSWKHWEILCSSPWFAKELVKWREEREIREIASAKSVLLEKVRGGDAASSKAIIEINNKRKAGRPSKIEVESEKKKAAAVDSRVSSILERMSKH